MINAGGMMYSKNINISISSGTATTLSALQNAITDVREAQGVRRGANQADAICWALQNAPMPTKKTYQVNLHE